MEDAYIEIKDMTDDFSKDNLLTTGHHWKLYRGKFLDNDVIVKVWDTESSEDNIQNDMHFLLEKETVVRDCTDHGFALAVVFDFATIGTLDSKLRDECFSWTLRVKAALEIARTISFLHNQNPPFVLRNLEPAHILLDKNYKPVLFDYGFGQTDAYQQLSRSDYKPVLFDYGFGQTDAYQQLSRSDEFKELHPGHSGTCLTAHDVFDFGSILLAMIAMRPVLDKSDKDKHIVDWVSTVGKRENRERMLFHPYLLGGEFSFGDTDSISALGLRCVGRSEKRPSMRQIVAALEDTMYLKRSIWRSRGMTHSENQEHLSLKTVADIEDCTRCFAADHLLGELEYFFVHIRLYQGRMKIESNSLEEKEVTVKICKSQYFGHDHFEDEVMFLTLKSVKSHPNLAKLIGYCEDRNMVAVIYDLVSTCTLQKKISDMSYSWSDRIKAILGIAKAMKYLHSQSPPYILHNLNPANIVLDKKLNPVLVDYGVLTGGIFSKKKFRCDCYSGAPGYEDPYSEGPGEDVYSFGIVILALISAKDASHIDVESDLDDDQSILHPFFRSCTGFLEDDAKKIVNLARNCVNINFRCRPAMKKVVRVLGDLNVS